MANLRRKLEKNPEEPRYLFTEVGVGYRLAGGKAPNRWSQIPPRKPKNKKIPLSTRVGLDRDFLLDKDTRFSEFFAREKWRPRKRGRQAGWRLSTRRTKSDGIYIRKAVSALAKRRYIHHRGGKNSFSRRFLRRSAPAWHGGSKNAASAKYLAPVGHPFTQAWHLVQMPLHSSGGLSWDGPHRASGGAKPAAGAACRVSHRLRLQKARWFPIQSQRV